MRVLENLHQLAISIQHLHSHKCYISQSLSTQRQLTGVDSAYKTWERVRSNLHKYEVCFLEWALLQ